MGPEFRTHVKPDKIVCASNSSAPTARWEGETRKLPEAQVPANPIDIVVTLILL